MKISLKLCVKLVPLCSGPAINNFTSVSRAVLLGTQNSVGQLLKTSYEIHL